MRKYKINWGKLSLRVMFLITLGCAIMAHLQIERLG